MDCDVLHYYSISIMYHDLKKMHLFTSQEPCSAKKIQYQCCYNTRSSQIPFSEPETRQKYIQAAKSSEHGEYLF